MNIISLWEQKMTNLQISLETGWSVQKITMFLNRKKLKSHRYITFNEEELTQLLIGSYLGDGHFSKTLGDKQSHFILVQGLKQEKYLLKKVEYLKKVNLDTPVRIDKTNSWKVMKSKTHPLFSKWRNLGYNDSCYVNLDLIKNINSEGLAIWFFDDGCAMNDGLCINCSSMPSSEKEQIVQIIDNNIGLKLNIAEDYLYIKKNDVLKFKELVSPFGSEDVLYKTIPYRDRLM